MTISPSFLLAFLVATAVRPSLAWAVVNDDCEAASSLNINERVQSINLFASVEPKCDSATDTANGVFYAFQGNGNIMTATTCGEYTQFPSAVYVSTGCDEKCVPNENPGFTPECAHPNGATVTFDSVADQTYYAQIAGRSLQDEGVFEFKVQDYPAPDNDVCAKAQKLIVTDVDEPMEFGECDLKYATKDLRCDGEEERGIWFVVRGTGNDITVSTCYDVEDEFVHDFHIQTTCDPTAGGDGGDAGCGAGCAALVFTQCIATDNPSFAPACQKECGSTQTFKSQSGTDYYVIVHGSNTHRTGKVKIAAWQYPPVPHDVCTDPFPLEVGANAPYVSSTKWAESDSISCGGDVIKGRGLWHTFTGTGKVTTISTDHPETDFETEILVLEDCNNKDYCPDSVNPGVHAPSIQNPLGKKFTLDSEKDKRYRVFIYGSDPDKTGNYRVSVDDYDPPANDKCGKAVALTVDGAPVEGTTEFATVESLECPNTGADVEGRGVWYTFRGSGTSMTVSTCYAETDHPAELYFFEGCGGDCSAPIEPFETFVCNSGFGKQITIDTRSDQFYHVLVAGSSNDKVGNHKISVEKFDPPVNDVCERAVGLTPGADAGSADLVGGTTLGSTAESSCNGGVAERGVWYTVAGSSGKRLTVTTCAPQTNVDFTLEVRTDCSINTCLPPSPPEDDGCSSNALATTVSWESFDDFSYLVYVSAPVSGNFGIKAYYTNIPNPPPTPTPPPPLTPPKNNICERPVNLIPGGNLVMGTTLGATAEDSCNGGIPQEGVWYIVPGKKNKRLTVTTCAPQTNVDVDLELRTDCNIETCVQPSPPQDDGCPANALATTISWESFEGFSYLIYVSAPVSGEFGIKAYYSDKECESKGCSGGGGDFFPAILNFVQGIFATMWDFMSDLFGLIF